MTLICANLESMQSAEGRAGTLFVVHEDLLFIIIGSAARHKPSSAEYNPDLMQNRCGGCQFQRSSSRSDVLGNPNLNLSGWQQLSPPQWDTAVQTTCMLSATIARGGPMARHVHQPQSGLQLIRIIVIAVVLRRHRDVVWHRRGSIDTIGQPPLREYRNGLNWTSN